LTKAAPGVWTLGRGDTVNWDSSTQAGNGNQGVAQIVSGTDGAIGYVDYALPETDRQNAITHLTTLNILSN
jgi:ABC-type phosphate transport system substrate-binding protein